MYKMREYRFRLFNILKFCEYKFKFKEVGVCEYVLKFYVIGNQYVILWEYDYIYEVELFDDDDDDRCMVCLVFMFLCGDLELWGVRLIFGNFILCIIYLIFFF